MGDVDRSNGGSPAERRPQPSNWGRFGADDNVGTLNYLTPEAVLRGVAAVRSGVRYPLNLPLDIPVAADGVTPAFKPDSPGYRRDAYRCNKEIYDGVIANDDYISFATQGSSQWDSLAHVGLEEEGVDGIFYNGVTTAAIDSEGRATRNGIDSIAQIGISGRGVLIDIARFVHDGRPDQLPPDYVITPEETRACLAEQDVEILPGDIVCFRTGWTEHYLAADTATRATMVEPWEGGLPRVPGISPQHATMADEQQWAAVAADNAGVDALPLPVPSAHVLMLRNLGMPFGEQLLFGELSAACAADHRYDFLFVAMPLWIPGGTGSPANAIAIR